MTPEPNTSPPLALKMLDGSYNFGILAVMYCTLMRLAYIQCGNQKLIRCFNPCCSEESELWPLFAEHFTVDEQQYLVCAIWCQYGTICRNCSTIWFATCMCVDQCVTNVWNFVFSMCGTKNTSSFGVSSLMVISSFAQVGVIIGRTGAQVLQALLPWISGVDISNALTRCLRGFKAQ